MMRNIEILRATRKELTDQLAELDRSAGEQTLTRAQQGQWDRIQAEIREIDADIAEVEAEQARHERVAESQHRGGFQVGGSSPASPWDGVSSRGDSPDGYRQRARQVIERAETLTDAAREALAEVVEGRDHTAAQILVARSNPAYESAFAKIIANPERAFFTMTPEELASVHGVESARAAMATTTGTAGYLIPLSLDPNVVLSNAGATNPIRAKANVKQVISSPHRAITSAGITAAWVNEGAAIGDASPTFVGKDIPLYKMAAYIVGSYEILQDAARDLSTVLPALLADARDRLEANAFTVGSGSDAPTGIVTALAAASAFVTATTRGSFTSASSADTLALINALTPRTRQSDKTVVLANNAHISTIRQQTIGTAGSLLMDLSDDGKLLGFPVHEASAMASVTTSGTYMVVAADLNKYQIVDHVSGPALEFVPNVFNGDGAATGQRAWIYHARTGADLLDTSAGVILKA